MIYRDKVTVMPGSSVTRANVKVVSPGSRYQPGGGVSGDIELIVITFPKNPGNVDRIIWRGGEYSRNTRLVPIVALGRVDHYELTALRTD